MANRKFGSVQGLSMRTTSIDECGNVVEGPCGAAVSDGYVNLDISANIDEGEEFEVKTANGNICISEKECPQLKWYDLAVEFCNVDPQLFSNMSASVDLITDVIGDTVGYAVNDSRTCTNFALEVWTKVAGESCGLPPCGPQECQRWIYWAFPWLTNGILGDYTIENGPLSVTWTGNTRSNGNWGQGPYNVICLDDPSAMGPSDVCATPGPLADTPVAANQHLYKRLTCIAPPTVECGCVDLVAVPEVILP